MKQNTLFNLKPRSSKTTNSKTADKAKSRKPSIGIITKTVVGDTTSLSAATMEEKIARASILSKKLLGDKLSILESVTQEERLVEYTNHCIENGIVSLDTETNGLDKVDGQIAGVCLYTPDEKSVYIPVGHLSFMTKQIKKGQIPKDIMQRELNRMKEAGVKFVFHNAKFDMHICYWMLGVSLKPYWDTFVGSNLLNENESHNLKYQWNKYVKRADDTEELAKFNKLFDGMPFTLVPIETAYIYAANDPLMTFELYEFQKRFLDGGEECKKRGLEKVAKVFNEIEMPLIEAVWQMEVNGIKLDTEYAEELRIKYTKLQDEAIEKFNNEVEKYSDALDELRDTDPAKYGKLSNPINISSPTQLSILLYDVLGLVSNDKDKPRGTGDAILEDMSHPVTTYIREYRKVNKLLSTYIEALPQQIKKKTGRIHANFNQYGAKTGRFSSSDPNLQNIPSKNKEIRKMFSATDGYVLMGADYSQQEPRCLAHMSGDEHMKQAYIEGKDLYAVIASKLYNEDYDNCLEFYPDGTTNDEGKKRRNSVKPVLLGIMYGRQPASIAQVMGISKKEAEQIIKDFFTEFPAVADFVVSTQECAATYGYVETACGRKRRLPDMLLDEYEFKVINQDKNENFNPLFDEEDDEDVDLNVVPDHVIDFYSAKLDRAWQYSKKQKIKEQAKEEGYLITDNSLKISDAERQCVNSVIQGSSADITKTAMIALHNNERLKELGFRLLLTVHDEVIGEAPIENAKEASELMSKIMIESAADIVSVPMKCDCEITEVWYGDPIKLEEAV